MDETEIDFMLTAENSSGKQILFLVADRETQEFWFTLCGEFNGRPIQIDFNSMTKGELQDLSVAMQLILDES